MCGKTNVCILMVVLLTAISESAPDNAAGTTIINTGVTSTTNNTTRKPSQTENKFDKPLMVDNVTAKVPKTGNVTGPTISEKSNISTHAYEVSTLNTTSITNVTFVQSAAGTAKIDTVVKSNVNETTRKPSGAVNVSDTHIQAENKSDKPPMVDNVTTKVPKTGNITSPATPEKLNVSARAYDEVSTLNSTSITNNSVTSTTTRLPLSTTTTASITTTKPIAVPPLPKILIGEQETTHRISLNESLLLNCTANGSGNSVNYTWYKENQSLPNNSEVFFVNATSLGNPGKSKYWCKVCNSGGCTNHIFNVTIVDNSKSTTRLPISTTTTARITTTKASNKQLNDFYFHIQMNQTQLLNCTTNESGVSSNYSWYNKDDKLLSNNSTWLVDTKSLNKPGNLTYTCRVCSSSGCRKRNFYVTILGSKFNERCVGDSVTLVCELYNVIRVIEWFGPMEKPTDAFDPDDDYDLQHIYIGQVYERHNLTRNDSGWYVCVTVETDKVNIWMNLNVTNGPNCKHQIPQIPKDSIGTVYIIGAIVLIALCGIVCLKYIMKKDVGVVESTELKPVSPAERPRIKKVFIRESVHCQSSEEIMNEFDVEVEEHEVENHLYDTISPNHRYEIVCSDLSWEFPREEIYLEKVIGQGAFGKVHQAKATNITPSGGTITVAVKKLRDGYSDDNLKDIVAEMHIMKLIGKHRNIVSLLKCCTQGGELLVVMEYAGNGSLIDFLKRCFKGNSFNPYGGYLKEIDSLNFSLQIARGMEYLASKKCVHRDLAARNVLVTDDHVLKIADFGLARNVCEKEYYRKETEGKLPIRWMAPEALTHRFNTTQSDVWSFAVVMWEIWTMGAIPYSSYENQDIEKILKSGERLNQPDNCSYNTFILMRECWRYKAEDRPTFSHIVKELETLIDQGIVSEVQSHNCESETESDSSDLGNSYETLLL